MSEERRQTIDLSRLTRLARELDGVDFLVVVSDEGFPIAIEGVRQEEAEAAAAAAVDFMVSGTETIRDLLGKEANEVIVEVEDGRAVDVQRARGLLAILGGRRKMVEEAAVPVGMHLRGESLLCPHCRADLTLEPYTCPSCGAKTTYTAQTCPSCGANIDVKKCPSCGGLLNSRGKPVAEQETARGAGQAGTMGAEGSLLLVAVNALMTGIAGGLAAMLFTSNPLGWIAAGLVMGGVGGFIGSRIARR